jgi:hypothetical protein
VRKCSRALFGDGDKPRHLAAGDEKLTAESSSPRFHEVSAMRRREFAPVHPWITTGRRSAALFVGFYVAGCKRSGCDSRDRICPRARG